MLRIFCYSLEIFFLRYMYVAISFDLHQCLYHFGSTFAVSVSFVSFSVCNLCRFLCLCHLSCATESYVPASLLLSGRSRDINRRPGEIFCRPLCEQTESSVADRVSRNTLTSVNHSGPRRTAPELCPQNVMCVIKIPCKYIVGMAWHCPSLNAAITMRWILLGC